MPVMSVNKRKFILPYKSQSTWFLIQRLKNVKHMYFWNWFFHLTRCDTFLKSFFQWQNHYKLFKNALLCGKFKHQYELTIRVTWASLGPIHMRHFCAQYFDKKIKKILRWKDIFEPQVLMSNQGKLLKNIPWFCVLFMHHE